MKNKSGFTLVELIAVIALIAILAVFAVPNLIKIFQSNISTLSRIQQNQIKEAAGLYIEDYCINPISDSYICSVATEIDSETQVVKIKDNATLSLSILIEKGYFNDDTLNNKCSGYITFINGEPNVDGITCEL